MSERVKITTKTPESKRDNSVSRIRKTDSSHSLSSPIDKILVLQRTIGNQAVQRLFKSGVIQAKLRIGQPNDKYEQEADRVAEQVMRMPEPRLQRQVEPEEEETLQANLSDGPKLQRQEEPEEEEEEEPIQTKQVSTRAPTVTPSIESRINSLKGGGQPLDPATRSFFEPRIGHDFSEVRVHTDNRAADTAQSINARAFTHGRDVVFDFGQYSPGSRSGRSLLAHELTHVVQQNGRQLQRAQSLETGEAIQYTTSLKPDAQMKGGSETPGEGIGTSGVRSDGAVRHGSGQAGVPPRSAGVHGNPEKVRLNFLYSRVQGNQHRQRIVASLKRDGNDPATPAIQRAPPGAKAKAPKRKDYIFIMGRDPLRCRTRRGRRRCRRVTGFYALAFRYYRSKAPGALLISDRLSLFAVLSYVTGLKQPVGNLYLVSHANKDGTLSFPISGAYKRGSKTTFIELKNALALPQVSRQIIDQHTTIHIKGCDIGRSKRMLDLIDEKFGGKGTVVAPTHKQFYGTKRGSGTPYEAFKGYFVEQRGAVKLRRARLLAAFCHKYPHLTARQPRRLLRKVKRRVSSHTAFKNKVFLPTKGQAAWRSIRRRWFPPRGYVKIGREHYKVDGLISYKKKTAGTKFIKYVYTYKAKRKNRPHTTWAQYYVKVPTHKKVKSDATKWANANLARPGTYAWKVQVKRKGPRETTRVIGRRTEYRIPIVFTMHRRAKEATYYGRSTFTP